MESKCCLFDLGKEIDLPIWDIIRYQVYIKYYYSDSDRERLERPLKRGGLDYLFLIKSFISFFLRILFIKGKTIIFTASRYKNKKNEYFDKSALHIIENLRGESLVMEPILRRKLAYPYFYDFSNVIRRFNNGVYLSKDSFEVIEKALINHLGECRLTYEELNRALSAFNSDYSFYKRIFRFKRTERLIIATGNPKAQIKAAKELNISTFLLQHQSIEFDEIDYSYPDLITIDSRILFPEVVLTLGKYWCKGLNVPANIVPIGNDFFFNRPELDTDGSLLVVSTIVHGGELKLLTKELATLRPDLNFVYKLHPNEFQFHQDYLELFSSNKNIKVITNEIDTNVLIARCSLVILIVSAVLYEALNQNKKVAIYKKINFERQIPLAELPNVYLFDTCQELIDIVNKETMFSMVDFYKPLDRRLIQEIFE